MPVDKGDKIDFDSYLPFKCIHPLILLLFHCASVMPNKQLWDVIFYNYVPHTLERLILRNPLTGTYCQISWVPVWVLYPRYCDVYVHLVEKQSTALSGAYGESI